ncbi:MAG: tetratricopeptide repeat protein [Acidobacteria bacterium]|nr:tetratricopeptide repeat protein [Acidobacteriota bacterium]
MNKKQFDTRLAKTFSEEGKIALMDAYAGELFDKENYSEAAKIFSQALKLSKQPNVKAYFAGRIGVCHFSAGNDQEALKNLLKSKQLFEPDKPEFMSDMYGFVHFHLGSLYEYHGKVSSSLDARKVCEQYINSQEKDTQWMLYAGLSRNYEALGKHDEAIRYTQKAIQVLSDNDPGLSYLYESMANNYMGLQQYQEAIKHFSRVLELDPKFERRDEIQLRMADCYRHLANYRMALETYEKLLELKQITSKRKDMVWLYLKIAECYFRLESFEKSLLVALETLRRNPRNRLERTEARSYLTNSYYEMGRYKEAVEEGEQTLKLSKRFPNDDLFYMRMALSYHKLGDQKCFATYRALFRSMYREDGRNKYLDKLT